jgi:adenosylmethionine-8-amino-7-oxononanoate aminotransferase
MAPALVITHAQIDELISKTLSALDLSARERHRA